MSKTHHSNDGNTNVENATTNVENDDDGSGSDDENASNTITVYTPPRS